MFPGQNFGGTGTAPQGGGLLPLAIVADDLTGACDAAVAFTGVSADVRVELEGEAFAGAVCAVTTDTRHSSREDAEATLEQMAKRLPEGWSVFKKVDSVFRGNTLAEIGAALRSVEFDLAVLAPAYPALGRTVVDGVLRVRDLGSERRVDVAEALAGMNVEAVRMAAGLSHEEACSELRRAVERTASGAVSGAKTVLCDGVEQEDLRTAVRAACEMGVRILWIGSGGLAHAVAAEVAAGKMAPSRSLAGLALGDLDCDVDGEKNGDAEARGFDADEFEGNTVFFIGSGHAVSRGQVRHLQRMSGCVSGRRGEREEEDGRAHGNLLLSVSREMQAGDIGNEMEGVRADETACLFMTGGDTARMVCRGLGIRSLRLLSEFAPGVPLAVAEGGRFDGVPVVLKSGGFGERDLLCRVLDRFGRKERVPA